MANFPQLKTGAVMQYPAGRQLEYRNQTVRFVDGNEQRYRDSAGPLRRWTIRLNALDATEVAAIRAFFAANQGRFANFTFTDPWDASTHENCSIASDSLTLMAKADFQNATSISIVENRG